LRLEPLGSRPGHPEITFLSRIEGAQIGWRHSSRRRVPDDRCPELSMSLGCAPPPERDRTTCETRSACSANCYGSCESREPAARRARSWRSAPAHRTLALSLGAPDLHALVAFYAEVVVVESSSIVHRWGREDGIIRGREELPEQLARGLKIVPEPSVPEDVVITPSGYASLMRTPNGIRSVDAFHLDDKLLIQSVTSLFSGDHR
jgi:hypothetical protein